MPDADDKRILDLAEAVSDGASVDWDAANREASGEQERLIIRRLQAVAEVARLHREPCGDADRRIGTPPPPHGPASAETTLPRPLVPLPGRIGDYRIVRKLGEGGMGVVYEAEQQHPKRAVALKVIRGGRYVNEHHVRLFQREAQTLARLKHPGIAAIYESGRTDEGEHFFAMEMVRGDTLTQHLKSRDGTAAGPGAALTLIEIRYRLRLMQRLCEAVAYAHQRGVIRFSTCERRRLVSRGRSGDQNSGFRPGAHHGCCSGSAKVRVDGFTLKHLP